LAFLAGFASFLSPCVLPLVPAYLGYLAGASVTEATAVPRRQVVAHAAVFVSGFSVVFMAFWISIGLAIDALHDLAPLLRQLGGVVLIVMGLNLLGMVTLPWLYKDRRWHYQRQGRPRLPASFLVGMLFAAGWTPCIGPVLGSIIGLASLRDTVWQGAWLLLAYCVGLGLPFLLSALALGSAVQAVRRLRPIMPAVNRIGAVFIIVVGILMVTNSFTRLAGWFDWGVV
jgi:cytochrome c-type biogenesis protein